MGLRIHLYTASRANHFLCRGDNDAHQANAMSLALPYRVSIADTAEDQLRPGQWLVYGSSAEAAASALLQWYFWIRKISVHRKLIQAGTVTAEVLRPWHVYFWRYPARERYLHAVTSVEALAQCEKLLGLDRYQLNIEVCDDIRVLWTLSDRELEWQCRYLWRGRGPATEFGQRVPGIQRRWSSARLGVNKLTPSMRQLAIYALRLAQEVEAMGPDEHWRGARARAIAQQKRKNSTVPYRGTSHRVRQAYQRHSSNVPDAVIQTCLDAGLRVPVRPYTPAVRAALMGLAEAYGYDVKTMTLGLMMLLWVKGPAALDDA